MEAKDGDENVCLVTAERVTMAESQALDRLIVHAEKKGWTEKRDSPARERFGSVPVVFNAPVSKVAKVIAKALKPGREIISVVRFSDGKMSEVTESPLTLTRKPEGSPYRQEETAIEKPKAVAGTSIARPTIGCPEPDFPPGEEKARRVLRMFLTPDQLADFEAKNRFVVVGAQTGHRYMVTSRTNRDALSLYRRTLYDLDERSPICVHDYTVPPAEEMLGIALLVQLPGYEEFVRALPIPHGGSPFIVGG